MSTGIVLAGAYAFLILGIGSMQAAPLAPAVVGGSVVFSNPFQGTNINTFGTFPLSGPNGFLQFIAESTPAPFLSAHATMIPFFFGRSSGTLVYQVEIVGPTGDVPVSIAVSGGASGNLSSGSSGDLFAGFAVKAGWELQDDLGILLINEGIDTLSLTGGFSESFGQTHSLMLKANHVYRVTMRADASARGASATAFIDPIFSFGPGVGPEYSFLFSDGIGNSSVPEPGSLALIGVGIVGACLYRKHPSK